MNKNIYFFKNHLQLTWMHLTAPSLWTDLNNFGRLSTLLDL